ncbi:MAG: hypothetical protein WD533_05960 [Dehalococcoidia bacterium]
MPKTSSGRWLAGIVAAVVLLAVVSIGVTLIAGGDVEELPEGTPERAVQDYLMAAQDRDYIIAYDLLAPEVQEQCSLGDYTRSISPDDRSSIRVRLDSVQAINGASEVTVRVTTIHTGDPIPNEFTNTHRYLLEETDGEWLLTSAPWPYNWCTDRPRPVATPTPEPTPTPEEPEA